MEASRVPGRSKRRGNGCLSELPRNTEQLPGNRELISRVITHTFDVRDVAEAFAVFLSGASGKVIVTQGSDRCGLARGTRTPGRFAW